jgi:hypothetical protein
MDGPMSYLAGNQMTPIVDSIHHTSFPDWLQNGFANEQFPDLYERYLAEFANATIGLTASRFLTGRDYYSHSEIDWYWHSTSGRGKYPFPGTQARWFANVAENYADRFGTPVMLTETNIRGTATDRLTWLKHMREQAEQLAAKMDFVGFCWYPSSDITPVWIDGGEEKAA